MMYELYSSNKLQNSFVISIWRIGRGGGVERFFLAFAKRPIFVFLAFGKSNHLFVAYIFYRRSHHQYFASNLRFLITSDTDPIAWIPS